MPSKLPSTFLSATPPAYIRLLSQRNLPSLCPHCSALQSPSRPSLPSPKRPYRPFFTTSSLAKKGSRDGKKDSKRTAETNAQETEGLDAFDFSDYNGAIQRAHEHLKSELAKVKAGGRNPEGIENVRVKLDKGSRESVKLGDVASVVFRGRNVGVLVGEKDHVKPIISALQTSPSNYNPTTSPTDTLTITIPIPPTTMESRNEAKTLASRKGEDCNFTLREARGAQRKRLRAMELGKQVGPDEGHRALKEMEKINEGAVGEVRRLVEGARRGLDG